MANTWKNDVKFVSSTTGTADFGVSAAAAGFRTPAQAGYADGQTVSYTARVGTDFESGLGTIGTSATVLQRTTVRQSSNSNAAVSFASAPTIVIAPLAEDVDAINAAIALLAPLASPTFTGTVTVPDASFSPAKLANMATSSLFYRKTAGSGAPEVNTLATLKTDLGLTGTNSGDQTVPSAASASDQETATSTTVFVNPAVQQRHPSAAKCWIEITVTGGTPTNAASFNVTSITDTAVGKCDVTINVDFSSTAYACVCGTEDGNNPNFQNIQRANNGARAAGAFQLQGMVFANPSQSFADPNFYNCVCFGDQ